MAAGSPDILVIGGGVAGLWCALRAAARGFSTVLAEAGRIGQEASGGILGALMPHQPVNPTPKKAFQLEALLSLEGEIAALEAATGIETGYRRCGRIQPLYDIRKRDQAREHARAAARFWPRKAPGGASIRYAVLEQVPDAAWLDPAQAPFGIIHDTLSARIEPRSLMRALTARAGQLGVDIREKMGAEKLARDGSVSFADGTSLTPGHTILAAGVESFALAAPLVGKALGTGVKGQAALLQSATPVPPDMPILFDGGVYVIAHESGLAAIGSTSEDSYTDPAATDEKLDAIIARAKALCPMLGGARVVERWAGVRPKSGRDPLIGPLPDAPKIILCTGGYKITLGIAHRMADKALAHTGL
jgi:glycine/D-amino acid oxidase-like deaminating enzyme